MIIFIDEGLPFLGASFNLATKDTLYGILIVTNLIETPFRKVYAVTVERKGPKYMR